MFPDNMGTLPGHIGIIMDGNGRWATKHRKPRTAGHSEGLKTAKAIVKYSSDIGIPFITLYAFSTENWKRASSEVSFLMDLITFHLKKEMQFYIDNHIRVVHSGDYNTLPPAIQQELLAVTDATADFTGTTVNLALNYGGRDEIIRSINRILKDSNPGSITEELVSRFLDQPDIPDPDLIIRTGGETRISNFLIWQCAYSELYISGKYWPDWDTADLDMALKEYGMRNRRFGGYSE